MKELLAELQARGVRLMLEGDELRVAARPGALDDALRQSLRAHKPQLLELLRAGALAASDDAPSLVHDAAARHAPFALTDLQHAYWLGRDSALDMGSVATHLYVELACFDFDLARAQTALRTLIAQHDMLRAVVDVDGQQRVLQQVAPYVIACVDASTRDAGAAEAAAGATRDQLSHQVMQADRWPLFDVRATQLPGSQTRLHVSLDLLILDAWSIFLFFREWHRLYLDPQALTAPDITYRDYLQAEAAQHDSPRRRAARTYWAARVPTLPPAPDLPLRPDPAARRTPRFSRRETRLPQVRWQLLKAAAREQGLTPSSLLLAAYAEVLARWSRSPHFTLNVTTGSRKPLHPEVHRLLGDFTSLVLHEVDAGAPRASFAAFAQACHQRLLEDLEHGDHSGVVVRRDWARHHGLGLQAAMPVVFSSGLVWSGAEEVGNLEQFGRKVHSISQTSQVWLDHHVMELGGDLVLIWDAADAVFEPGVLDAMFACYEELLNALIDEPALWQLPYPTRLPASMTARRTTASPPLPAPVWPALHAGLVEHARADPQPPALLTPSRTLSRGQLLAEATAVADRLRLRGIAPGELVPVVMVKGWEQVVAVLGVLLAGGAYVPVDADLPALRQLELLRLCEARQVLTAAGGLRSEAAHGPWQVHEVDGQGGADFDAGHASSLALAGPRLAYVIFTSGSTGVPKGVMVEHAAAVNTVQAVNALYGVGPQDRALGVSSLSFDLSVYDIFGVLGAGGALVLPDARGAHDAAHWQALMLQHGVTLWNSAPQLMRMLLDSGEAATAVFEPLRTVMLSGDFIPLDVPARLRQLGCRARLWSLGGATEAAIWSNHYPIADVQPHWSSIPYGRALPRQTMAVLDHALQPVPDHVRGRIHIGGAGLARGYLQDAATTAKRFIHHPRSGERLYDTGDLGTYDGDGEIVILGRDDGQVKIRGHRIELGEIEAALRQHPDVGQAVTVARDSGAGTRQLVAYVVAAEGAAAAPDGNTLRAFVSERLPAYMVPRQIAALDRLPLSANGKLDRKALPDIAGADDATAGTARGPSQPFEGDILAIWQRVMPGLEIGVSDNFFELGGDSVLATQLLRELNAALPVVLEMHELFENLTVESLAALVAARCGGESPAARGAGDGLLAADQTLLDELELARKAWAAAPRASAAEGLPAADGVLLTGATGWVGAHLLAELLHRPGGTVTCLVRGPDDRTARERLLAVLQRLRLVPEPQSLERLRVLAGDLLLPQLGLRGEDHAALLATTGTVYHLAATVGVLQAYAQHRATNVAPLHDLLALCAAGRAMTLCALSPLAVCRRRVDGALEVRGQEVVDGDPRGLLTGYAQSKWLAEQLLWLAAEHGLTVRLYRSSHALPPSSGAAVKENDTYLTMLQLACEAGAVPEWPQARLHGLPVDTLCALLVDDARSQAGDSAVVHLEQETAPLVTEVLADLVHVRQGSAAVPRPLALHDWQQACLARAADWAPARQALARALFERRGEHMALENMFSGHDFAVERARARFGSARLCGLTPPAYWRRVLGQPWTAARAEAAVDQGVTT